MSSNNLEEDFHSVTDELEVPGTSYRCQLGLINGKWASRLLKGRDVIDTYVYKDEDISVIEEERNKIESIMKKESVDEISFERQYLPEIFDSAILELSDDDGLPMLKGFVIGYFRVSGILTKIHGKVIKFFRGNIPFHSNELFKKMQETMKTIREENDKKDFHKLKELIYFNDVLRLLPSIPEVKAAAIVSKEGLPIASVLPQGADETRIAAITAALLSLAVCSIMEMEKGEFDQLYVKGTDGYLLVLEAGANAILIVSTTKTERL